jgi:hypothetical protein
MRHKSKYVKFREGVFFELRFESSCADGVITAYLECSTEDKDVKIATLEVDGEFFAKFAVKYIGQKELLNWLLAHQLSREEMIESCVHVVAEKMSMTTDKWVIYIDPVVVEGLKGEITEYEASFKSDKGIRFTLGEISANEDDEWIDRNYLDHLVESINQEGFDRACYDKYMTEVAKGHYDRDFNIES